MSMVSSVSYEMADGSDDPTQRNAIEHMNDRYADHILTSTKGKKRKHQRRLRPVNRPIDNPTRLSLQHAIRKRIVPKERYNTNHKADQQAK